MVTVEKLNGYILRLERAVGRIAPQGHFQYPPLPVLVSEDLREMAKRMLAFVNLIFFRVEVVMKPMGSGVSGRVHLKGDFQDVLTIEVDPELMAHTDSLIMVLAHEIAHKYLEFHHLTLPDSQENEELTDVTSVYLGFGRYVLDGCLYTTYSTDAGKRSEIGYLKPYEFAYVYDVVCHLHGEAEDDIVGRLKEGRTCLEGSRALVGRPISEDSREIEMKKKRLGRWQSDLDAADLELCNVEKIAVICPSALLGLGDKLCGLRRRQRKVREVLSRFAAANDFSTARLQLELCSAEAALAGIAESSHELFSECQALNRKVSARVSDGWTCKEWEDQGRITVACPDCAGKLRLPVGKGPMSVRCPRCDCHFDYDTRFPTFKWNPAAGRLDDDPRYRKQPGGMPKRKKRLLWVAGLGLLAGAVVLLARLGKEWSRQREEAERQALEERARGEWEKVRQSWSIATYEGFIREFASTSYAEIARKRLAERKDDPEFVCSNATIRLCREYLAKHPGEGADAKRVDGKLADLLVEKIKHSDYSSLEVLTAVRGWPSAEVSEKVPPGEVPCIVGIKAQSPSEFAFKGHCQSKTLRVEPEQLTMVTLPTGSCEIVVREVGRRGARENLARPVYSQEEITNAFYVIALSIGTTRGFHPRSPQADFADDVAESGVPGGRPSSAPGMSLPKDSGLQMASAKVGMRQRLRQCEERGEWTAAISILEQVLAEESDECLVVRDWVVMALLKLNCRDRAGGIQALDKAIELISRNRKMGVACAWRAKALRAKIQAEEFKDAFTSIDLMASCGVVSFVMEVPAAKCNGSMESLSKRYAPLGGASALGSEHDQGAEMASQAKCFVEATYLAGVKENFDPGRPPAGAGWRRDVWDCGSRTLGFFGAGIDEFQEAKKKITP